MSKENQENRTIESSDTADKTKKKYHRPVLEDFGDARDLTRANSGVGPDGAISDGGIDGGLDAPGTAS